MQHLLKKKKKTCFNTTSKRQKSSAHDFSFLFFSLFKMLYVQCYLMQRVNHFKFGMNFSYVFDEPKHPQKQSLKSLGPFSDVS